MTHDACNDVTGNPGNLQTFDNDSEMLAPDLYYHRGCIKCAMCGKGPDSDTPIMMAPR